MAATERIRIPLPVGFNPERHTKGLLKLIGDRHGEGFEIDSIDPQQMVAYASRQAAVTEVTAAGSDCFDVRLVRGTRPSDGDRIAAKLASQHEGYSMVRFEPFLGRATLARMDAATLRCRDAVAGAIGVKPWEVHCSPRSDGGFSLQLPTRYTPSRHDDRLAEVATSVVGRPGWYVTVDAQKLTGAIIPAEPPTFPPVVPYPFDRPVQRFHPGSTDWARIPLGKVLPRPGQDAAQEFVVDVEAAPHQSVVGTSGSGKSNTTAAFIAGALARGAELGIVDQPSKSVDFLWAKPFVRPGFWGCDSLAAAVTAMALVHEEGCRRARVLADHEVNNWLDLPAGAAEIRPLVVIVDEVSSLFYPEKVPKGLPKDSPLVLEPMEINLQKAMLEKHIKRTAAELRFVGIKLLLSTQVASTTTGIDTSLRMNLGNKLLLGVNPTDGNRRLSLSDAGRVPKVPSNLQADARAGRGAGVAELEGAEPCVFKSYFASTDEFRSWLLALGVPTTDCPAPTAEQIAKHTPSLEIDARTSPSRPQSGGLTPRPMRNTGLGADWATPTDGPPLDGFARANLTRRQLSGGGAG